MLWIYLVFNKGEWLSTLKRLIKEYGPTTTNSKTTKLKFLRSDFCKELQNTGSAEYLRNAEILLHSSTPYKHAQNPAERKWQQLKSMHTSAMLQNNTPVRYWCYTLQYTAQTYRWLPQSRHKISRNEEISGEKSDITFLFPRIGIEI